MSIGMVVVIGCSIFPIFNFFNCNDTCAVKKNIPFGCILNVFLFISPIKSHRLKTLNVPALLMNLLITLCACLKYSSMRLESDMSQLGHWLSMCLMSKMASASVSASGGKTFHCLESCMIAAEGGVFRFCLH